MNVEPLYADETQTAKASPASNFLRRLVGFLWWSSWVLFAGSVFFLISSILALAGVEPIKSQMYSDANPGSAFMVFCGFIIYLAVFLVVLKQLRYICKTLVAGDPFVPENANRLRLIWIAIAVGEIIRQCSTFFFSYLHNKGLFDYVPKGSTLNGTDITIDLRAYVWFLVLAFIIFAEVFREGARLRQEQKLTV